PDESFSLGPIYRFGYLQSDAGRVPLQTPLLGLNEAPLQRWPVEDGDLDRRNQPGFGDRVRARQSTTIMDVGDYDHDGWATEFVLPVGGFGCLFQSSVVIGISRRQPKLHVFGTAAHPEEPLTLGRGEWKLLRQSRGRTSYVTQPGYFHSHGSA